MTTRFSSFAYGTSSNAAARGQTEANLVGQDWMAEGTFRCAPARERVVAHADVRTRPLSRRVRRGAIVERGEASGFGKWTW